MATGGSEDISREYFVDGDYTDEESQARLFSRNHSTPKAGDICRFCLIRQCMFGDNCSYAHASSGPRAGSSHRAEMDVQDSDKNRHSQNRAVRAGRRECSRAVLTPDSSLAARTTPQTGPFPVRERGSSASPRSESRAFDTPHSSSRADAPGMVLRNEAAWTRPGRPVGSEQTTLYRVSSLPLCPHERPSQGCPWRGSCRFQHRDLCDLCKMLCLHPYNEEQRMQHMEECMGLYVQNRAAEQRKADHMCGICHEVVIHKELPSDRRFGILEKCSHVFCLRCIRKWRASKEFDSEVVRSCPLCRTLSNFVIPSNVWVDAAAQKELLIADYKSALSHKPCRYFNGGRGICLFRDDCFYQH